MPETTAAEDDISEVVWHDAPAIAVFWVLAGVVFLQFFSRYIMNSSIGWTEEIARYLLICVTFVGAVIGARRGTHIAVEVIQDWMPLWLKRPVQFFVLTLQVGFFGIAAWIAVKLAMRTNQLMASIDVSKAVIYWLVAASLAIMCAFTLGRLWRFVRGGGYGHADRLID